MKIQQLISANVPTVSLSDNADKALLLMQDYHLIQLPLLSNNKYIGIVSEDDLLDWQDTNITFADAAIEYFKPIAMLDAHIYDGAKIMKEHQLQILPIVDNTGEYIGAATQENVFNYLLDGTQCIENGGILVVEVTQFNFSISHIARVFESENVTILSFQIHNIENTNLLTLTIKTNKQDLRAIVATLERLNYSVKEIFSEMQTNEDLESNFAGLMNYLNV
jgi:acetoin utilization protein AcuB